MLTRADIHEFLEENGIGRGETVLIHASMRSLGDLEGGCDGLIDAFTSYLTEGLLIIPTHTWATVGPKNPIFDVSKTEPCIGALPTVAAFRSDGIRSLHPTHSVAAFGKRAKEFIRGEEFATSPCSSGGVWQRLFDEDAKILLIGVGLDRNTYIHAIDEMLLLPDRLADEVDITVIGYEGERYSVRMRPHGVTGSRNFENYRRPLEAHGALKNARLGSATVGIFDTGQATEIIKALWARADYNLCGSDSEIPTEYYSDLKIQ